MFLELRRKHEGQVVKIHISKRGECKLYVLIEGYSASSLALF